MWLQKVTAIHQTRMVCGTYCAHVYTQKHVGASSTMAFVASQIENNHPLITLTIFNSVHFCLKVWNKIFIYLLPYILTGINIYIQKGHIQLTKNLCKIHSTDDAIAFTRHTALSHLNTYVRMLFVDYSLAFNTTVPFKLVVKLRALGLNNSLCSWILDFLTGRRQVVRIGSNISSPLTLNTGAPQGCVLSCTPCTCMTV